MRQSAVFARGLATVELSKGKNEKATSSSITALDSSYYFYSEQDLNP